MYFKSFLQFLPEMYLFIFCSSRWKRCIRSRHLRNHKIICHCFAFIFHHESILTFTVQSCSNKAQYHITEQKHKHYKYFCKTSFSQCLENTTNAWMASNHINHTNTRMSQVETRTYSFIIDSRWYIIHATLWKHEEKLGLYIKWGIKAANGSVSIKPLTLNTASDGLRNRRGRAEAQRRIEKP